MEVNKAGFGVQVSSLSSYENAMKELTRLQGKNINNALLSIEPKADAQMAFKRGKKKIKTKIGAF